MELKTKYAESDVVDSGIRVCMSTEDLDRQGDIMRQRGIDFMNFKANPVVLWNHEADELPIGNVDPDSIETIGGATYGVVKFADHEFARAVEKLYRDGVMKAWSVGFLPKEITPIKNAGFEIKAAELVELSAVAVPANPDALSDAINSNESASARKMLRKAFDLTDSHIEMKREVERMLKSIGYSGGEAKAIANGRGEAARGGDDSGAKIKGIINGFSFLKK